MPRPVLYPSFVVLAGLSGSGKSALLHHLEQTGYPVIDIELLLQHSGSVFGGLTFNQHQINPEDFITRLKAITENVQYEPIVFTECKGRSVGNILLPSWFMHKMRNGYIVHLEVPVEKRIDHLEKIYREVPQQKFIDAALKLDGKLSRARLKDVSSFLEENKYKEAIRIFLEYYDVSDTYNYYIKHAQFTLHLQNTETCCMMEMVMNKLRLHHPLFADCL